MYVILKIRIPRELKERMDRLNHVDWDKELRELIEARLRALEAAQVLREIRERARSRVMRTDSVKLIREDRDGR